MQFLPYFFILLSTVIILVVVRMWLTRIEKSSTVSDELTQWLKEMSASTRQVDQKMTHNMDMFNSRLDKAAQAMMQVQKHIGEFSEIGRSMQQLQQFLQSPKLRGNIGEQVLKELLSQSLPPETYMLQYAFKSGERVDAIVKTSQGMIAIDSKFPLSSFKKIMEENGEDARETFKKEFVRDVKKHIASISGKYILPAEGTLDYALMYIPSESVYYELINQGDIYDYASEMRVVPVSPMSFYAYLKVILISHEGQRVQKQAKEILVTLQSMRKDYEKTEDSLAVLNKHIGNAYNQSSNVMQNMSKLGQKIESTASLSTGTTEVIES